MSDPRLGTAEREQGGGGTALVVALGPRSP